MIMRTAAKYFKGKKCKRPMSLNRQDGERGWEGSVQACREGRGVRTGMCAGSGQACVCVLRLVARYLQQAANNQTSGAIYSCSL